MHPTRPAAPLLRPSPQPRLWRPLMTLGTPLSSAGEDLLSKRLPQAVCRGFSNHLALLCHLFYPCFLFLQVV